MICYKKSTLQVSKKPDITCAALHELICNAGCKAADLPSLRLSLKPILRQHA
ncbi:MAG: hypothetical protein ACTS73_01770 [Arsenophonus sp. NEOnobi-MAG3]